MNAKKIGNALIVSDLQAYLDLYARGGRDLKQVESLLNSTIRAHPGSRMGARSMPVLVGF